MMDFRSESASAGDALASLRVVMLVMNDVRNDSRVQKEARVLAEAGAIVTIVGTPRNGAGPWESDVFDVRLVEPMVASESPLWPWRVIANLAREYRLWVRMADAASALEPDVIHCHDLDTLWAGMHAVRRTGARLVYDAHELFTERSGTVWWRKGVLEHVEARAMREADLVFSANAERAGIMCSKYGVERVIVPLINVPPSTAWVSGPSPEAVAARAATGCNQLLIYQGGIQPTRGLEAILEAATELPDGVGLVLLGADPTDARMRGLVSAALATGRVFRWPVVSPDELPAWAAVADAGVVTYMPDSLNNTYCAPNKLYEYAAAGIAILGADLPTIRGAVDAYGAGELFVPGNQESFLAAANRLLNSEERLAAARAGANRLRQSATWEAEAAKLVANYERLLVSERAPRWLA